ncbi:MAG TPA: hypothetical protein GXX51_04500 [Firmicutes bacterium]|nr:hypothetical protein [Bacillota bacterium]
MARVTIKRPVTVKVIVTETFKAAMLASLEESINEIDLQLKQMEFQAKRFLADLEKQSPQQVISARSQIESEREKRREARERLLAEAQEVAKWEIGQEVTQGVVEGLVDIGIGDDLRKIMATEIIVKDGIVAEIREGNIPEADGEGG